MFFSELKRRKELILKNLSIDEIFKQKKKLIEEFASPDEFDLPSPVITKEITNDKVYHIYTTHLNDNKIETIFIEQNNQTLVSYKVNGSIFKNQNFKLKSAIDILSVVGINFLHYISVCEQEEIQIIFETSKESMAKIDERLLGLCDTIFPFVKFKRRSIYE